MKKLSSSVRTHVNLLSCPPDFLKVFGNLLPGFQCSQKRMLILARETSGSSRKTLVAEAEGWETLALIQTVSAIGHRARYFRQRESYRNSLRRSHNTHWQRLRDRVYRQW